MTNKHLIDVVYLPASERRPSRVRLISGRFADKSDCVRIPYDHSHNNISDMAIDWLISNGYTIFCQAETAVGMAVLVNEFVPLKTAMVDADACNKWRAQQ